MRTMVLWVLMVSAAECAVAEDERRLGWYGGGGISASNVFAVEGSGLYGTSERGSSDTGFVISGGYRLSRNIAFEIGYLHGGAPGFSTLATDACPGVPPCIVDAVQKTTAFAAGVVALLPLGESWEIHIKGGAAIWDASSDLVLTPIAPGSPDIRNVDADGTDFMLAIGGGITVGDHTHLRLEYLAFRTDDDLLALDASREARFDQFALELLWRF